MERALWSPSSKGQQEHLSYHHHHPWVLVSFNWNIYPSATECHGRGLHRTIFLHTLLSMYLGSTLLGIGRGHQFFFLSLCSHMVSDSSSLFMSMSNLIWININFVDMKMHMLICFFISMLLPVFCFSILSCCIKSDNQPQEILAKSGYKTNREIKNF